MRSRVRVTSHKSLCLSCKAKKEEETLKLLAAAFSGLHWWDGWCLFPPQPPASHPTPAPAPGLPCRPGRGFLKQIDWVHCKLYASADQLAREKGWLCKARATQRGQAGPDWVPVDGSAWTNTGTPMAAGGGSQAQNGRLRDGPAETLGCLSLPVVASRRGGPPLHPGRSPSCSRGAFWGGYV